MSQVTVSNSELASLIKVINSNTLLNRQLQAICGTFGLSRGGVKAELRNRLVNLAMDAYNKQDAPLFRELRQRVEETAGLRPTQTASSTIRQSGYREPQTMHQYQQPFHSPYMSRPAQSTGSYPPPELSFHRSPFYEIKSLIGGVKHCPVMSQHRNSVTVPLKIADHPELRQHLDDKKYRVMVFCAGDNHGVQDISFPHQSEIKKPGSTRPVDISDHLRLLPNYINNVELIYALTTKVYYLAIYLCKSVRTEDLVARIRTGQKISKSTTLREMAEKSKDTEIETTSQVMSLKCPLSYMRLDLPVRGLGCSHMQCFDATSYLQLQEQGPQWICPICSRSVTFDQLAVDEYVLDILSRTPRDLEQVTLEPDGQWRIPGTEGSTPRKGVSASFDIIEDLEISIPNGARTMKNSATPNRSIAPSIGTPSMVDSRESTAPRPSGGTSTKRPAPAVIDLTLSSDDEDAAPPPQKRQQLSFGGFGDYRSNGHY
ncbi:unnamed protein product [Parascedosporium putredinis]|uniref:Uncharacterized protein n=1 Tax=Parascedosporium putredinis TaxID=1442378 RepID=A0A9P1GVK4_9PEZI|nr:unnamed protein product [Parascedosporium putredinis]CAI7988565.1 unnamed protein product [Parascedosporium putredinis]